MPIKKNGKHTVQHTSPEILEAASTAQETEPADWPKTVSYLLFAALLVAVIALRLGAPLLAGLFSFMVLDLSCRALLKAGCPRLGARWGSLLLLTVAIGGGSLVLVNFIRNTLATVPKIAAAVVPKLVELSHEYGVQVPFENVVELRDILLRSLGENLGSVTQATGILTAGTMRILFSIAVAVLFFMTMRDQEYGPSPYDRLRKAFNARILRFMEGFEKVLGAQVIISLINTLLTACYLIWVGIPHLGFLIPATFILGIVPIVGNIMSNCLIVGTALTISLKLAIVSLGFLVFIHTLEHFLNSRIVGGRIQAPMWLTLLSIMVGELVLGVPGIIIAPTMIHYIREELQALRIS